MSQKTPDEASVKRHSSLKSKIRNLSINRRKAAHFEEGNRSGSPMSRRISFGSDSEEALASEQISSSNASLYPVASEDRGRSQARRSSQLAEETELVRNQKSTTMSQAQLASPVLTKPTVVSSTYSMGSQNAPLLEDSQNSASLDSATPPVPFDDTLSQEPKPRTTNAGGFLSSVLNAASNLGTVLGSSQPKSPKNSKPSEDFLRTGSLGKVTNISDIQSSPAQESIPRKGVASVGLGTLSLKDIGVQDGSKEPDSTQINSSANPQGLHSGSVLTTRSRRRRGSNAMSTVGLGDGQGQKITGFAVASNKRNREFHAMFRSVPEADYLLDDYGCALQKEILVHGRMYVSESHICFNSNIFGWVTNLVLAFTDVVAIEKRSTAAIFPNAIQLATGQAKHTFASFISRDTTYDLIVNIWRLTHPMIQTTAHGVEIANNAQNEDYGSDSSASEDLEDSTNSEEEPRASDSDQEADLAVLASPSPRDSPELTVSTDPAPGPIAPQGSIEPVVAKTAHPGPTEHGPTQAPSLSDGTAFPKQLLDECFEAPLGLIYELLFGDNTEFMENFLRTNQKLLDVKVTPFSDRAGQTVRSSSYVKPLSGPIGPKQTRCLLEDIVEVKDFEKYVQVLQSTTSPDVPSGDAFVIKTRFNLMWGPANTTRLVSNCVIEWSKNSWIKGPIEKASSNGQMQFMADLSEAIKQHLSQGQSGSKKKRKSSKSKHRKSGAPIEQTPQAQAAEHKGSHGVLDSITTVLSHINLNILTFVVIFGMMLAMMRMQRTIRSLTSEREIHATNSPLSVLQWQSAESDLWTWLAERTVATDAHDHNFVTQSSRTRVSPNMVGLQLEEALRQSREQVAVLESAQKKGKTLNKNLL